MPHYTFTACPAIDVLVVPGGFGTRTLLDDPETLNWIRNTSRGARHVTSVCTGSLLLAKAGLLAGRRATTHWGAVDLLRSIDPSIHVDTRQRVVSDTVISSAGVAAGIDMAFFVVETLYGQEVADETAHYVEYPRTPVAQTGCPDGPKEMK